MIIQCYAPTYDSEDDDKDQFYERLQSNVKCLGKDQIILERDKSSTDFKVPGVGPQEGPS